MATNNDVNRDWENGNKLESYLNRHENRRTGRVSEKAANLEQIERETGITEQELPGAIEDLKARPYKKWSF